MSLPWPSGAVNLFRYRLLDIMPIAANQVVESMADYAHCVHPTTIPLRRSAKHSSHLMQVTISLNRPSRTQLTTMGVMYLLVRFLKSSPILPKDRRGGEVLDGQP